MLITGFAAFLKIKVLVMMRGGTFLNIFRPLTNTWMKSLRFLIREKKRRRSKHCCLSGLSGVIMPVLFIRVQTTAWLLRYVCGKLWKLSVCYGEQPACRPGENKFSVKARLPFSNWPGRSFPEI